MRQTRCYEVSPTTASFLIFAFFFLFFFLSFRVSFAVRILGISHCQVVMSSHPTFLVRGEIMVVETSFSLSFFLFFFNLPPLVTVSLCEESLTALIRVRVRASGHRGAHRLIYPDS